MDRMELGRAGEDFAARYLEDLGCRILERNFRCRYGEIDIIALDGSTICFVEVKTRSRTDYGPPCMAVDRLKEQHIRRSAYVFLRTRGGLNYTDMRIDIVEVLHSDGEYEARRIVSGREG